MKTPTVLKRKKSGVTDYRKRLALLRSESPRLVVRPSRKGIVSQLVEYEPVGDRVMATVTDVNLKKEINTSGNNTQVAYLSGYMLGLKAATMGVEYAILDPGRYNITKGGRIAAVLKGFKDAGIDVPSSDDIFPGDDRIQGKHLKKPLDIEEMKKKIQEKVK
ncbi:MAG: 50S ribosomal protein L18 [Candidatus Thermoplasmatota archaeon]|jgi:large subunit ribosomal protein L18|nr:50S ribosomal protein L18 [Candidatus Thermoplasmatota archaeon]MCL5790975.1 50S ribosomal protein L18 [Candidatus Thermoplasmatota archaeon]